jgi:hypothetical protein
VLVAALALLRVIETLRRDEMQFVLGARHRHIKQPPLLFQLGRRARAKIGRHAAIDDIEHEHVLPLLPLG